MKLTLRFENADTAASASPEDDALVIADAAQDALPLLHIPGSRVFLPDFAKEARLVSRTQGEDGSLRLEFAGGGLARGSVAFVPWRLGFLVRGAFTPSADAVAGSLDIFPAGTKTAFWRLDRFRTAKANPEQCPPVFLCDDPFSATTKSDDWQMAPHPTAFLFRRGAKCLMLAATEAPVGGYGLVASGGRARGFDECRLDFGGPEWGVALKAGEEWRAPEFALAFGEIADDPFAPWAEFAADLVALGKIPDPAKRRRPAWHRGNLYDTWGDQQFLYDRVSDEDLAAAKRRNGIASKLHVVLDEAFVRKAAATIRRERLPIDTILLDSGWNVASMDWRADPVRFPDFRRLVDDLHADGFKVMVWWNWSEIRCAEALAAVGAEHCVAGGKPGRHKMPVPDYSLESTQEEFLKPMLRRLFSDEEGCYALDGFKIDYMADKVHPEMPAADPSWRGEENFFLKFYTFLDAEIRRWRPDAQINCGSGNWFLAHLIDVNRDWDILSDDPSEHENRCRMFRATAPGVPVQYDFSSTCRESYAEYLASARSVGASVEVGSLFRIQDVLMRPVDPGPGWFELLRTALPRGH